MTALVLLVMGAALRPLIVPEHPSPAPILTADEIGFAQDMSTHHQQAILLAQRLDPSADPGVRQLANQIMQAQELEVGTMLGWLRLANVSPTSAHPMAWMHDSPDAVADRHGTAPSSGTAMPGMAVAAMPGMASQAELDKLSAARGRDADVLFLQLMYRHHLGGISMAKAADAIVTKGAVKESIRGMLATQSEEAGLMAYLLRQRDAQPLP
ncbi:DUF305 domain-containing protein [Nocardia stercoris]|uniref:DUF305 domain-containing protein n=2 Tax=Nocardia stercoris TaxID=2483361 RepID=A0A3M2LEA9_9NOCA|nr:DUF305 domain-containing protein [Nocardia stercoris]RMI35802.1 DUF305 domain-containing protein [Nocardia stercoris]